MKRLVSAVVVVMLLPCVVHAGGTVENFTFTPPSLGIPRDVRVYLPEGYDPGGVERYPIIYFLHGSRYHFNIYWNYFAFQASLDLLISRGDIQPLILVTPDGLIGPYWGGYWTNSELYGNFEDYIVEDLVAHMDSTYLTIPNECFRCIQGLSMGGYGALKLSLKHADVFHALASHAAPAVLDLAVEVTKDSVLAEYPGGPPYEYYPGAGWWSGLYFTRSGAFSPNMDNPPYWVDFPLDDLGQIIGSVMDRWRLNSPPYFAASHTPASCPEIFFDCGTEDEVMEYPVNLALCDSLDALGLPYMFQGFWGDHTNQFTLRFRVGVAHCDSLMHACPTTGIGEARLAPAAEHALLITGPNPSSGRTFVTFDLPVRDRVHLAVYDVAGRLVATVANRDLPAGRHTAQWLGRDLREVRVPKGVYLIRLSTREGLIASERVTIVR